MPASEVTAIVATCNRAHYLGEALDSVLDQSVPPVQVIVVNDGSTDQTAAVLKRYGERIEVIEQENRGKSHALNQAMPRVRGAYLWIFDDDDVALPHNVESHLAVLEAHPEMGFVYSGCSVIRSRPDGRVEHGGRMSMPVVPEDEIFLRMLEQNFMQQQAMLVRTQCYREVGPFDARLDRAQDYEMNLRLARRFRGKGLDTESFLFREHDGWRGRPGAQFAADQRSRRWIAFSRELLPRLRAELGLAEYLPRGLGAEPLDEPRRRRALLQRACLMARCALWEEALADFGQALVDTMRGRRSARRSRTCVAGRWGSSSGATWPSKVCWTTGPWLADLAGCWKTWAMTMHAASSPPSFRAMPGQSCVAARSSCGPPGPLPWRSKSEAWAAGLATASILSHRIEADMTVARPGRRRGRCWQADAAGRGMACLDGRGCPEGLRWNKKRRAGKLQHLALHQAAETRRHGRQARRRCRSRRPGRRRGR